jgi:multidrug efflux pump subunit AcrA (membrane-fusion protein)
VSHSVNRSGSARAGLGERAGLAGALLLASAGALQAQGPIVWPDATPTGVAATRTCFSESVRLTGYLLPRRETFVTLNAEGFRVTEVLAQEGDTVSADQELIRLTRLAGDEPPGAGARGGPPRTLSLRAPAAGVISRSTARAGALTRAQGEPLMRLVVDGEIEAIVESRASTRRESAPAPRPGSWSRTASTSRAASASRQPRSIRRRSSAGPGSR